MMVLKFSEAAAEIIYIPVGHPLAIADLPERLLRVFDFHGEYIVHLNTPFLSGNEKSPLWMERSKEGYVRLLEYYFVRLITRAAPSEPVFTGVSKTILNSFNRLSSTFFISWAATSFFGQISRRPIFISWKTVNLANH